MIKIVGGKVASNNIPIDEEVYIRIIEDRRESEADPDDESKIYTHLKYRARLKSQWLLHGLKAKTIVIDGLVDEVRLSIDKVSSVEVADAAIGAHVYANGLFIEYVLTESALKDVLVDTDITRL